MATPVQRLKWVCVGGTMQVFWPACVYPTFSLATTDGHDLQAIRALAPTLDREEVVVYFFGVGANASQHASIAPNLQLCVLPAKSLTVFPWEGADEFDKVCRTHNVAEESISRALTNPTFRRACAYATRFADEALTQQDARRLLLSFLTDDISTAVGSTPTKSRTPTKVATPTRSLAPTSALPPLAPRSAPTKTISPVKHVTETVPEVAPTGLGSLSAELVDKCWRHMQTQGWQTLRQPNGTPMFIMPGVQFVDFKPNVTVFNSLALACTTFLAQLARQPTSVAEVGEFGDLLWAQMQSEGWQTMQGGSDSWFVMPNTKFENFVPNVTIFQSKQLAITKYLQIVGVVGADDTNSQPPDEEDADTSDPEDPDNADPDSGMDEEQEHEPDYGMDEEEEDPDVGMEEEEEEEEEASQEEADSPEEEEEEEGESEEEEEAYARITRRPAPRPSSSLPSSSARGRLPKSKHRLAPQQPLTIPQFKLLPGKVEQELARRGWYWKPVPLKKSPDGYMYYQPYCREQKDESKLKLLQDCFPGRVALDVFLEASGLAREIEAKLRREHEHSFAPVLDSQIKALIRKPKPGPPRIQKAASPTIFEISDSEEEEEEEKDAIQPLQPHRKEKENRAGHKPKQGGASRRKPAPSQIKRLRVVENDSVSFGEIQKNLRQKGWTWLPGKFEYDYIKPGKNRQTGVPGEDYFTSRDDFIAYLRDTGLWEQVEDEVRCERAAALEMLNSRVPENESNSSNPEPPVSSTSDPEFLQSSTTPQKRKTLDSSDDKENQPPLDHKTPETKKQKTIQTLDTTDDFRTPPATKRHLPDPAPSVQIQQSLDPEISPDAKPKPLLSTPHVRTLHRDAFTPTAKQPATATATAAADEPPRTPRQLAEAALERLTLAHEPERFAHREEEARQIHDFCSSCFADRRGGSLYLSGAPGCGKSALVKSLAPAIGQLFERVGDKASQIVPVHVNAMAVADFGQLFQQLAAALTPRHEPPSDKEEALAAIAQATSTTRKTYKTLLLVLDEIDALATRPSLIPDLGALFSLAHRPHNAVLLVGIANQVDFTERHLLSLFQQHQQPQSSTRVVVFQPYSFQTLSAILTDRLGGESDAARVLNGNGLAFIARKVASQSGDVRLALDICRRLLAPRLGGSSTGTSSSTGSSTTTGSGDAFPVPLTDIVRTIKSVLESRNDRLASLPRNLHMILFAATRLADKTLYPVEELYASYEDVSHEAGVFKPLSRSEFRMGLDTLSHEGLLGPTELKKSLVKLLCTTSELLQALRHDAYFARLL